MKENGLQGVIAMYGEQLTRTTAPAQLPVNLSAGEPTPRGAILTTLTILAIGLIGAMGLGLLMLAVPTGYGSEWSIWRVFLAGIGLWIFAVSAVLAGTMFQNVRYSWNVYYDRMEEWHQAALAAYNAQNGLQVTESYDRYNLDPTRYGDVLAVVRAIYRSAEPQSAFTRRALEEPLFLDDGAHAVQIGTLNGIAPERIGTLLSKLGVISGRSARVAGTLAPPSFEDAVQIIDANWHKVANSPY